MESSAPIVDVSLVLHFKAHAIDHDDFNSNANHLLILLACI